MRGVAVGMLVLVIAVLASAPVPSADDSPASLDQFKAAATRIVDAAGLPGAGIALVRSGGIEWAGGIGWADRDAKRPITADTLFRVGSVSKTFVAMALVQLYEEGTLDLDATVASVVPDSGIDNPWNAVEPLRIRHLLEHTAGLDDMHFNDVYVLDDAPDLPLAVVLTRSSAARRVRWRPGTRMAYSNPGYAVAGRVIEASTGQPFDDVIREKIFAPLDMHASTFRGDVRAAELAHGYDARTGPPVTPRRIHLRPAGALHSTPLELGRFVEMLLNWGERGDGYVIDPEYLSNMEWPRTTAAATAGVRAGYGLGIRSTVTRPFHVLGHQGGIDGFASTYGYSPSRDVGYVVLLNGSYAPDTLTRLASLALRYLKRDVAPPPAETAELAPSDLQRFEGYYHDANPRREVLGAIQFPLAGVTIEERDGQLTWRSLFGAPEPLIAVNDALFRRANELTASMAFTEVSGVPVLTGGALYAEKRPRWPIDLLRLALAAALTTIVLAPAVSLARMVMQRRLPSSERGLLDLAWLLAAGLLVVLAWSAATSSVIDLAAPGGKAEAIFLTTLLLPFVAVGLLPLTAWAIARGTRGWSAVWAGWVACAHLGISAYLGWWGLLAFRSWTY